MSIMSKNNCKYLLSVKKSLGYGDSQDVGIKVKIKTATNKFAYVMKCICQSLFYGNTDQIGRSAWNGFMSSIQNSVATFVNEWNAKYKGGKDPQINPRLTPDFLPDEIPEFIYTTTHNNSYNISIGMITSSLTMEKVMSVYEKAKETEERKKGNREPGATAGGVSATRPGPSGDPAAAADIPEYTQEQKDYRHMREMLRTLSSAMDKPIWDNCTNLDDPCVMPNIKRIPDITIVVDPENAEKTLSYPILIGEVLGSKDKGPRNNQLYEGYNATMQCLVFAPRAYYFEIETTDAALTILHKNPAEGTITAKKKVYELRHKNKLLELINDLSAAFLDEMINLRPIAHITASALRQRKYKDFLSPPPGRGKKLQLHCWHVFVPDYHHARGEIPDEYNAEVDNELVVPAKYRRNQIPDCSQNQLDNSVIEVDEFNIKDNTDFFEDVSFCRGHRNPLGTPINMKGQKYSDVWKEKAKYLKHQMVIEDVKKILEMVAQHFRDHIVRKKITESLPEINPAGENEENVWVMTNDTKGVYLKLLENENVVISHAFPDPVDPEDEDAHLDPPPPPPEPEEEEVIGKLKFTSYTSNKIRQYYTEYIEKKNAQQAEHPEDPYIFPHSEWTPGKPSKFARQLRKMLEGGDSVDPLSKRLTYDEEAEREESSKRGRKRGRKKAECEREEEESAKESMKSKKESMKKQKGQSVKERKKESAKGKSVKSKKESVKRQKGQPQLPQAPQQQAQDHKHHHKHNSTLNHHKHHNSTLKHKTCSSTSTLNHHQHHNSRRKHQHCSKLNHHQHHNSRCKQALQQAQPPPAPQQQAQAPPLQQAQ